MWTWIEVDGEVVSVESPYGAAILYFLGMGLSLDAAARLARTGVVWREERL